MIDISLLAEMIGQTYGSFFVIRFDNYGPKTPNAQAIDYNFFVECKCGRQSIRARLALLNARKVKAQGCFKCVNRSGSSNVSKAERDKELAWLKTLRADAPEVKK